MPQIYGDRYLLFIKYGDKMTLLELFIKLLKFKSVTPDDAGTYDFLDSYLEGFECIKLDMEGVKNRLYYKKFGTSDKHLCFAGHIDVVPAGSGWEGDPFLPIIKDDIIIARGTQDMKSGVAAFCHAVKNTKEFDGIISILLTSDEEGDAKYGTIEMLKYLKEINFLPDFAIVAEPTCEEIFGDAIKVGRRGSINGVLTLKGVQGHAAYPNKCINPVELIAPILPKIAGIDLDSGDEYFAPSKLVITDIRAGMEVTNVTPAELKMMFNVRNSTKTDIEKIEAFINDKFKGLDFTLKLSQSAKPFVTNKESLIVKTLADSIETVCGVKTKLSTAGGTSDARFFGEFGVDTVEFGVINDTIHSVNERTNISQVEALAKIFEDLISKIKYGTITIS